MEQLEGKVAVVTGGASGIGFAMAQKFGEQGMKVVLADIEKGTLQEAAQQLEKLGVETLAVPTDVTRPEEVEALAEETLARFRGVHVVCNNAGVFGGGGACWEVSAEDYAWVLGVNTWGVIHGIRAFVPRLLDQDCEAHVVNTASMAGVTSIVYGAAYYMSKHAVVSLSESLYHELTLRQSKVGVSVLCPEQVATQIYQSESHRPAHLKPRSDTTSPQERALAEKGLREAIEQGTPPEAIADRVLRAIREKRFYILSEDAWLDSCKTRMDDIVSGRNPTFAPPVPVE